MNKLTRGERAIMNQINNSADAFDNADLPVTVAPNKSMLGAIGGNPAFDAQFDVTVLQKYYTVVTATGVYTQVTAATLTAALKTKLAFFLFGQADFTSGYKNIRSYFPIDSNWMFAYVGVYGKDDFSALAFDATVTANLVEGDLVLCWTSALPGGGTTSLATVIIRCTQVAYGTLLASSHSDVFYMNYIRYIIPDTTVIAQYSNNIGLIFQSLFGLGKQNWVSPNSFKRPDQQQTGIIDIPLSQGIDKQQCLASYINYDCIELSLSIYVRAINKLKA